MNSVNRVRPAVQFQCVSLRPFVYVQIVREAGKPINHSIDRNDVVDGWNKFCSEALKARQANKNSQGVSGGFNGKRTNSPL